MKMFKRIAPYLLIALFAASAVSVYAQIQPGTVPNPGIGTGNQNYTTISGWLGVVITIIRWIYTILFIVAVLFILLAAYNFVTSKGDPAKTKSAKQQLLYAVIGIAVGLLSYTIVTLVQNSVNNALGS